MTQTIKISTIQSEILHIQLSRPEKLNALSALTLTELEAIFQITKTDKNVKAILLSAEGKAFCAGADITQLAELNGQTGVDFARRGQAVFELLESLGKPSLAAIQGVAVGGGCELAMSASMRIATPEARFAQPEVKLGVIPGFGGTQRLTRLCGKGRALELCLTGKFISAETALQWGLINEIVSADQLISRSQEILQSIISNAPLALTGVLNAVEAAYSKQGYEYEAIQFGLTCATQDKKEGVNAFLDKKQPQFQGT